MAQPRILLAFLVCLFASACDCGGGTGMPDGGGMEDGDVTDAADGGPDGSGACEGVTCDLGKACAVTGSGPVCVGSCDGISCGVAQRCDVVDDLGQCVADCTGVSCPSGEACSVASGVAMCAPACNPECTPGRHCETIGGTAQCVDNECAALDCETPFVCAPHPMGGFFCEDQSCDGDLDCEMGEYCSPSTMICVGAVCAPGATRCTGSTLEECLPNGSGYVTSLTCAGTCTDPGQGNAFCPCADDWDCPVYTECNVDRCEGTGFAPSCRVPTQPMAQALPTNEITWGGTQGSPSLPTTRPFIGYGQVVQTPVVANLNDDNGDGLINERDFPEIIFSTFCYQQGDGNRYQRDGVLRAIHGGGNPRGQDFFAACGTTTWKEGASPTAPAYQNCTCADGNDTAADLDPTAGIAVGDLDGDGRPEIVTILEPSNATQANVRVRIYDNDGDIIATSAEWNAGADNPTPAIANLDGTGLAEIVVGRSVLPLTLTAGVLGFGTRVQGGGAHGSNGQGPISCIADLNEDGVQELIAGSTVYGYSGGTLTQLRTTDLDTSAGGTQSEGFCAVADVWGATAGMRPGPMNPLDDVAELIVVAFGDVFILNGQTGALIQRFDAGAQNGGAPNVDDFDGDGFPEVGTAGETYYAVVDLQAATTGGACDAWTSPIHDVTHGLDSIGTNPARTPPATFCNTDADCGDTAVFGCNENANTCVCLHNSWQRTTEDDSSRVTGSSVFDFNGDGAAEVVYNDECFFRIYDGRTGRVYFREPSESRTRIENPVVADVDNDGNAEIVFGASNESGFCSVNDDANYNNGIEVWGDQNDYWVSARRIFNEHAYHITNVTEGGGVPVSEPRSWESYQGRVYNSYRSNPQSLGGIAPDLVVEEVQVTSPGAACGTLSTSITISARIANIGDLRVGPGVGVTFYGTWPGYSGALLSGGMPITATLATSLEPGDRTVVIVTYDSAGQTPSGLPESVSVVVDEADVERECDPDNDRMQAVDAGDLEADLVVSLGAHTGACPMITFPTTIENIGSAPATNPVVRYFAGDPSAGGTLLHTAMYTGTVAPGASVMISPRIASFPARDISVFAVVDPMDVIAECNDANNKTSVGETVLCGPILD